MKKRFPIFNVTVSWESQLVEFFFHPPPHVSVSHMSLLEDLDVSHLLLLLPGVRVHVVRQEERDDDDRDRGLTAGWRRRRDHAAACVAFRIRISPGTDHRVQDQESACAYIGIIG